MMTSYFQRFGYVISNKSTPIKYLLRDLDTDHYRVHFSTKINTFTVSLLLKFV